MNKRGKLKIISSVLSVFGTMCALAACAPVSSEPHTHSYIAEVISPTCRETGYTVHRCACGSV